MTRRNVQKQEWVFPLFSPDSDDRKNLILNLHRFVILYISCDTRGVEQYCLPKVSNGFKIDVTLLRNDTFRSFFFSTKQVKYMVYLTFECHLFVLKNITNPVNLVKSTTGHLW